MRDGDRDIAANDVGVEATDYIINALQSQLRRSPAARRRDRLQTNPARYAQWTPTTNLYSYLRPGKRHVEYLVDNWGKWSWKTTTIGKIAHIAQNLATNA